ncbi:hypothetical protein EDD15DRAFT_2199657 [Pisolithus albus]|nr:hypothetical protein EDD15DRAFT_2199657 [Pisolithus albus]
MVKGLHNTLSELLRVRRVMIKLLNHSHRGWRYGQEWDPQCGEWDQSVQGKCKHCLKCSSVDFGTTQLHSACHYGDVIVWHMSTTNIGEVWILMRCKKSPSVPSITRKEDLTSPNSEKFRQTSSMHFKGVVVDHFKLESIPKVNTLDRELLVAPKSSTIFYIPTSSHHQMMDWFNCLAKDRTICSYALEEVLLLCLVLQCAQKKN